MAVGSGQTVAETQERGPEELHSVGPGQAGRGRGTRQGLGSCWLSPRRSRHSAHRSGSRASGLRLLGQSRPTPRPAPCPARRAAALGLGDWESGGGERRRGEPSARLSPGRAATHYVFAHLWVCVRLSGPVRGGGSVSPRTVACGRGEPTPPVALRTRGSETRLSRCARDLAGCEVVDSPAPFPSLTLPGSLRRSHTLLATPLPLPGLCAQLPLLKYTAVCFCWVCQCCLCSGDCVIA